MFGVHRSSYRAWHSRDSTPSLEEMALLQKMVGAHVGGRPQHSQDGGSGRNTAESRSCGQANEAVWFGQHTTAEPCLQEGRSATPGYSQSARLGVRCKSVQQDLARRYYLYLDGSLLGLSGGGHRPVLPLIRGLCFAALTEYGFGIKHNDGLRVSRGATRCSVLLRLGLPVHQFGLPAITLALPDDTEP